jgi:hypothetical protein
MKFAFLSVILIQSELQIVEIQVLYIYVVKRIKMFHNLSYTSVLSLKVENAHDFRLL